MGEVISIDKYEPHLSGKAQCLECKAEWEAVTPIGTISMECPVCGLMKGVHKGIAVPQEAWICNCGCYHFFANREGVHCCYCGVTQDFG